MSALDRLQQRHVSLSFPVAVIRKTSDDRGGNLAVLIAYYGFLGIFPLLLVFAAVVGFVLGGSPSLTNDALRSVENSFPALSGYIDTTVSGSEAALGVGLAGALWAGLGVTRATQRAMNTVWDIPLSERPNLWRSRLRGLEMLVILGATFLASTGLASVAAAGGLPGAVTDSLGVVGSLLLNVMLYLLAFRVVTNRHLAWRVVLPGAVAWTALLNVGAIYVRHEISHASRLYGSLAVVVGLLAWIYLGARVTLYAAEINVVLAERLWPRSLHGPAATDADRRALARQAREAQRSIGQTITVTFSPTAFDEPPVSETPSPAGRPAAGPVGSEPATVHHTLTAVALSHLESLSRTRHKVAVCSDRQVLADQATMEATLAAAAVHALAAHDPELAAALGLGGNEGTDSR